jgi:hypothetical protein
MLEKGVMPLPGAAPAVEVSAPAAGKGKQEVTRQQ